MYRELLRRYRACSAQKGYWRSVCTSLFFFAVSFIVNIYAIAFATEHASNSVTDIILSNTPVFDVDGLFVYGTFLVAGVTIFLALWQPRRIPFMLKGIALFWLIRSGFTSMTHLGPFTPHVSSDFGATITKAFFGGDDFFFSGHTGLPFLGALAFWRKPLVRYFFLAASILLAVVVLLGHLHYSIDVFSAFFITYTIFHIILWLFPNDWVVFQETM